MLATVIKVKMAESKKGKRIKKSTVIRVRTYTNISVRYNLKVIPRLSRAIVEEATIASNAFFSSSTIKNLVYARKILMSIASKKYNPIAIKIYPR